MNTELIKQKIKELDTNNIISNLDVYNAPDRIEIVSDIFCLYYYEDDYLNDKYYSGGVLTIWNETTIINNYRECNNIKLMKDTLDFLENNLEKIKQIIKNNKGL